MYNIVNAHKVVFQSVWPGYSVPGLIEFNLTRHALIHKGVMVQGAGSSFSSFHPAGCNDCQALNRRFNVNEATNALHAWAVNPPQTITFKPGPGWHHSICPVTRGIVHNENCGCSSYPPLMTSFMMIPSSGCHCRVEYMTGIQETGHVLNGPAREFVHQRPGRRFLPWKKTTRGVGAGKGR